MLWRAVRFFVEYFGQLSLSASRETNWVAYLAINEKSELKVTKLLHFKQIQLMKLLFDIEGKQISINPPESSKIPFFSKNDEQKKY